MIRNIINLKAIILYFGLILCLIAGMPTPAYGSSSYPVKDESYVLVINSYVDGERWSGNLLNMISKFATPEEYTLRIDHISVMLVDTPEKLKEKQEVFFEANKKKPDGIIYLGVNGWAFMRDKIREKWGDIPTLVCSETGEMAEDECYFNQRHSSDRVIPLQEAVKGYNATGLVIPYYVKGSIDLVKELIPGLRRLIFISDRRYVSTWLRDEMEKHMETSFPEGKVDFYTEGSCSMDSLLAVLSEKDPHRATAVMYYSWITEKPFLNHSLLYSTLYQGINGISRHPVFSLYDMGVEEGYTIGGYYNSAKTIETALIPLLQQVYNGEDMGKIPVSTVDDPRKYLNYVSLMSAMSNEDNFPHDAIYLNAPPSFLEKRITKIKEEKDQELMLVSLQLEKQRLEICNESILNKESKHLLSVAILRKSEVYEKFHDRDAGKIISEDWELLEVLLNKAYDDFTLRLKKLYPVISDTELKACMLTKIGVPANQITRVLKYNSSVLRPRLFRKIFKKEGSTEAFVEFISNF